MTFRKFLRILIPVCTLAAVSCTNEELILDASQTQRGRDFAEAFKARFENIDPNHTWIDGTVGKVMVTTDEKANIVVYGLGRSDNTAIRLKRCVVEGTQEVKYDIPLGCKDVVIRAYNSNGNTYKALHPENENDEVALYLNARTRASSFEQLSPMQRTEIPNVWNQYGSIAPWQSPIPNVEGLYAKFDVCDHDYASWDGSNWNWTNADLGWNFYFHHDKDWSNKTQNLNYTAPDNYWYNMYNPDQPMGYAYWLPTYMFADDNDFMAKTGLYQGEYAKLHENGGNHARTIPLTPSQEYDVKNTTNSQYSGGIRYFPAGDYYCFNAFGKRGSWWNTKDSKYGHFYTSNISLPNSNPGNNQGGDYLRNTSVFYTDELPTSLVNALQEIVVTAEGNPEVLKDFNNDTGLYTTAPGPVSVTWFYSETTTRDYVGYYYVKHINGESEESYKDRCDRAPKYLLLEATCTDNRTQGDTFPLTFYGENGTEGQSFTFPAGYDINFFVLHGRDSSSKNVNPHSGNTRINYNNESLKGNFNGTFTVESWGDNFREDGVGKPIWWTRDPTDSYGVNAVIRPERVNSHYSWLFYDTDKADNVSTSENGWTLNPYYICFSHGGEINEPAVNRIGELEFSWNSQYHGITTKYGVADHRIEEWYDGNYKPMVAFRYMGVNVVGFEDTPIEQYNGLDWNDCVFIINGHFNIPEINQGDLAFSMCMEDLGDTDDLDYNDLYMVVLQGWEEITDDENHVNSYETVRHTPRVILDMAGGILPLKVTYEDPDNPNLNQTLFEDVHATFGQQYAQDGNRVAINTVNPNPEHGRNMVVSADGSFEDGNIATVNFSDGAIVRCTRGVGNRVKDFDGTNFTSEVLANFSILDKIPNFKVYVTYEDGEIVCIDNSSGKTGTGPQDKEVNIGVNTDRVPYTFWIPSNANSESLEQQQNEISNSRIHPGYERQFIGDYLEGFDEWVANQNHTGRKWYDWRWGSDENWSGNKPQDPSQGGTGAEVTHDYWKTYTGFWGYDDNNDCTYIGPEDFRNTTDNTKGEIPNSIIIKINYPDTGHHYFKLMSRDTQNNDLTLTEVDESGRTTITKILDPNVKVNGIDEGQVEYFINQIAGKGENQGKGLAILWPKDEARPTSIQIHCDYPNIP